MGRHPGRFLLTGSANVLDLPKLSDSLAGRMEIGTEIVPLWPFSEQRVPPGERIFEDSVVDFRYVVRSSLIMTELGTADEMQTTKERRRNVHPT